MYRVERSENAAQPSTVWELLSVKRPFVASDLTFKTRPNLKRLGTPLSGTLTDVDHLYSVDGGLLRKVAGRQPGLPTGDQALLSVANDARARNLVHVKGHARVLGRTCTILEFVEPPVGGLSAFTQSGNHDDICLTPGGVILRDTWTLDGRVVQRREALSITSAPDSTFDTTNAQDLPGGVPAPRVSPLDEGTPPPPTPPGYTLATALDFALPRTDAPSQLAYGSKVWAFAKDADEITVEVGGGQVRPWNPVEDKALRLGPRAAASLIRSDGVDIHWVNGDHWVRVRGALPLVRLVPFALRVSNWDSSPAAVPK
ncbi:MAG TPA: hypothetical protein VHD87_06405 [Acidimicrobiales bacterium]|nr:hypothetical protein [Acidimicrobiales bacterium]